MPVFEAVADTGPLISLEKLPDGFALLKRSLSRLYLPLEVLEELQAGYSGTDYLADHHLTTLVEVVPDVPLWTQLPPRIGGSPGASSAGRGGPAEQADVRGSAEQSEPGLERNVPPGTHQSISSRTFPIAAPCSTSSCASAIRGSGKRTAMLCSRRFEASSSVRFPTAYARSSTDRL